MLRGFSKYRHSRSILMLAFAAALLSSSCAVQQSGTNYITDCELPADQSGTLLGHWRFLPVPVALQVSSNFNSSEIAAIQAAVGTWNTFFGVSLKVMAVDSGTPRFSSVTGLPNTSTMCGSSSIVTPTGYSGPVVLYKDTTWPYGSSAPNAMALTHYCHNSSSGSLQNFTMAVTELNYQSFFVTTQKPDLQTIILHELGHVMGLGHSCDTASGYPSCSANVNPDYLHAVMYPVFGFDSGGNGQQRRTLTDNDEGRANCLYQN